MRVLVNTDVLHPLGGVELSTLQVCRDLTARGHEIDVLYNDTGDLEQEWRAFAAAMTRVNSFELSPKTWRQDVKTFPGAALAARGHSCDVVYVNRVEQLVWGIAASRLVRAPLVVHLRGVPTFRGVRTFQRPVTRFIAISRYIRDTWIAAGVPATKIDVVHNGIDTDEYSYGGAAETALARERLGLPADDYIVLYYGRLNSDKGVDALLAAWREFEPTAQRPTRLLIVGNCDDPTGPAYLSLLHEAATDSVTFVPVTRDVLSYLHASDIAVLPARWDEPFGRVVVETLATGRPIVAAATGGITEILEGDLAELLFPRGNTAELAARLQMLDQWQDRQPALGKQCRDLAVTRFSLRNTVDGVERALSEAAARG